MKFPAGVAVAPFICVSALAGNPALRNLSFEDRVRAQEAIERVYYRHQLGATKPFAVAVPHAVLENKVRKYLAQTDALRTNWRTAVTDHALQREVERMAADTRMPERLHELYVALRNDPFLIKECLARGTLLDRLTRNFEAFDSATNATRSLPEEPAPAVASERATGGCAADGWDNRSLDDGPEPLGGPSSVWTGSEMLAWSTEAHGKGWRYDPAIDHWVPMSNLGAPAPRFGYSVIWTGASMVVWGGRSGYFPYAPLDTGARYDPLTDAWTPTSTIGAPSARSSHTALTTGTKMIVCGGYGDSQVLDSGGLYDPSSDTWSPTATVGAPSARSVHSAIWTGSRMVVFGGYASQLGVLNTGGRYDPIANTWTPTSEAGAPPMSNHNAVWTGGTTVVWDGFTGGRYDLASNSWLPVSTTNAPASRWNETAVWAGSSMVVWGGRNLNGDYANTGARYDPVADHWTPMSTAGAPSPRAAHAAVWTGQLMLVWGGSAFTAATGFSNSLSTGGRYDPATDTWTPTATGTAGAPSARSVHTAVWTGDAMIVWGGGYIDLAVQTYREFNTGGRYDPVADSWAPTSTSTAPSARSGHSAVWIGSKMVVWGGGYLGSEGSTGGRYDPAADTWSPTPTAGAPSPREQHVALWTGSAMLIWGGLADPPPFDGGSYDPASNLWQPIPRAGQPAALSGNSAVWTGRKT